MILSIMKTAQQQADELISKFNGMEPDEWDFIESYGERISWNISPGIAKKCALLEAQDVIDAYQAIIDRFDTWCNDSDWIYSAAVREHMEKWIEVKKILEK